MKHDPKKCMTCVGEYNTCEVLRQEHDDLQAAEIVALKASLKIAVDALEFYANPTNHQSPELWSHQDCATPVTDDVGAKATLALAKITTSKAPSEKESGTP